MIINILALLPFILIIYFLVIKGVKSYKVMIGVYFTTLLLLLFIWNMELMTALFATLRGVLVSLEVFLIIISVLMLFSLLEKRGKLEIIKNFLKEYSSNKHVQIIIIGWFVVSFFEGIAGFGTPAAIAAPLLVFLGFRALTAIVITLVADSVSVVFGAFGTPIIIGIASSISSNISLQQVSIIAALLNAVIALIMPLVLLVLYHLLEKIPLKELKPSIFFALLSGFFFAIPFVLTAIFVGPELPSVIAAVVGLVATILMVSFGVGIERANKTKTPISHILLGVSPYFVLIGFLLITRLDLFNVSILINLLTIEFTFLQTGIQLFIFRASSPGILIMLTFMLFSIIYLKTQSLKKEEITSIFSESFDKVKFVFITLLFTLSFVQLILNSNLNLSVYDGIPQIIGAMFSNLGPLYILVAPLIGAFGSFIAGSATVSNLIFSSLQVEAALSNGISQELILALQASGAAAGNMIAIHNILAVSALVGVYDKESQIIKINLIIVGIYCLIISLLGFILMGGGFV
ncbi:MAG: L-lactate permease [Nanoarchaeota archaeon]|nr:L-lactate permease [Nanoarchaeota archaeon]